MKSSVWLEIAFFVLISSLGISNCIAANEDYSSDEAVSDCYNISRCVYQDLGSFIRAVYSHNFDHIFTARTRYLLLNQSRAVIRVDGTRAKSPTNNDFVPGFVESYITVLEEKGYSQGLIDIIAKDLMLYRSFIKDKYEKANHLVHFITRFSLQDNLKRNRLGAELIQQWVNSIKS